MGSARQIGCGEQRQEGRLRPVRRHDQALSPRHAALGSGRAEWRYTDGASRDIHARWRPRVAHDGPVARFADAHHGLPRAQMVADRRARRRRQLAFDTALL